MRPKSLLYHMNTLRMFNKNDQKTILYPTTIMGVFSSLSGPVLGFNAHPNLISVLCTLPLVITWIWLNLLVLCVNNQSQPNAVEEDLINKPWRPMPSKRLTTRQAHQILLMSQFASLIVSLKLGVVKYSLAIMFLGYLYNDRGAGDYSCAARNLINALGFCLFGLGGATIASGGHLDNVAFATLTAPAPKWFLLIATTIFTTMHSQDMYDQEGDAVRNRLTIPLVIGDGLARWTIFAPVLCWSVAAPMFWDLGVWGFASPLFFGALVAVRTVVYRSVKQDRTTFQMWCVWITSLFMLPLLKRVGF